MEQSISSDLIRGHIDTIILNTLLSGDKFAQQISDTVEQKSNNVYKLNQATLYSSLKRLENLKLVISYWQDCDNGGRRKFFKLTDLGKETVENNLKNWSFSRNIIDKLIGCENQAIASVENVNFNSSILSESEHFENTNNLFNTPSSNVIEKQEEILPNPTNTEPIITQPQVDILNDQELNFRDILNSIAPQNNNKSNDNNILSTNNQTEPSLSETEINFRDILNNLIPDNNSPEQSVINLNGINIISLQNTPSVTEHNIVEKDNNLPLENFTEKHENIVTESDHERNFRNVLKELNKPISNTNHNEKEINSIKPIEHEFSTDIKHDSQDNSINKYSFKQRNHSSFKSTSIDYADLRLLASQDGLKLRISSKTSSINIGNLLINKLRLITSLSMFLILLIQLLVITSVYKSVLLPSPALVFALIGIFAVLPAIILATYLKNPTKTSSKIVSKDSILTTAIVVFNLLLINFACIMIANLDFTILKDVVLYAIIPFLVYLDILICSTIYYFVGNSTVCTKENKKTA